jgi:hypothetical protein
MFFTYSEEEEEEEEMSLSLVMFLLGRVSDGFTDG